jgi:subtilase family serine protease
LEDFTGRRDAAAAPAPARRSGPGLIALADQEAGHSLGFVNPAIYRIARGPLYHKAFHDVTTGNNTVVLTSAAPPVTITGCQAGPGWDPVTGWGTPDAQVLIPCWLAEASRNVPGSCGRPCAGAKIPRVHR